MPLFTTRLVVFSATLALKQDELKNSTIRDTYVNLDSYIDNLLQIDLILSVPRFTSSHFEPQTLRTRLSLDTSSARISAYHRTTILAHQFSTIFRACRRSFDLLHSTANCGIRRLRVLIATVVCRCVFHRRIQLPHYQRLVSRRGLFGIVVIVVVVWVDLIASRIARVRL